jgi:hypothetical protein
MHAYPCWCQVAAGVTIEHDVACGLPG